MKLAPTFIAAWFWLVASYGYGATADGLQAGAAFAARDSLACRADANDDAQQCLAGLTWTPGQFTVSLEAAPPSGGDWLVRFPSPRPISDAVNDLVAMEWYAARDKQQAVRRAPAVVVVHESGRRMEVGRLIARSLRWHGLHAFLVYLPGYGSRRVEGLADARRALPALKQAVADVRRARDAVAALPAVDDAAIGLQGTSLGGFVASTVAGLDDGYDRVFILLAGGNLHEVVLNGQKDAAKFRQRLAAAGVTQDEIRKLAYAVEPMRLAHRINPAATWMFSGKYDDVVPGDCTRALVDAAKLPADHHVVLPADHYSGIIYLPQVVKQMADLMAPPTRDADRPTGDAHQASPRGTSPTEPATPAAP